LIAKLNGLGVRVIVISGYYEVPLSPGAVAVVLQKPVVEAQLLAALRRSVPDRSAATDRA
jgi:FixJ family two-component response regulator